MAQPRSSPFQRFTNRMLFPDPRQADADGLLAYGGDLYPQRLLAAYAQGIFPWPGGEDWPMLWYSPDPRMVLVPTDLHISHSLRKALKKGPFEVRFDTAFALVIQACATVPRPQQPGTWITAEMIARSATPRSSNSRRSIFSRGCAWPFQTSSAAN